MLLGDPLEREANALGITVRRAPTCPAARGQPPVHGDRDRRGLAMERQRWKILCSEGRDDFERRFAEAIGTLGVRRRQAVVMLLLGLVEEMVAPHEVQDWMATHDASSDSGVEALIAWLRAQRRRGA